MIRAEAVASLKASTGIADPLALADWLQLRGLVADEAITPRDMATCDLVSAALTLVEK